MKLGKAKLILSVVCLTAALTLAVFTIYAWFISFTKVNANGVDSVITTGDVISFEIDYYYTSSENGMNFTIEGKIEQSDEKGFEGKKKMPDYAPSLGNDSATSTAVLLDLKIRFSKAGTFALSAKTEHGNKAYNADTDGNKEDFDEYINENYLSNVIYLLKIDKENVGNREFIIAGHTEQYSFINGYFDGDDDSSKKKSSVDLLSYPVTERETGENYTHHIYYLLDYSTQQINSMYSVMLQLFPKHATLTTNIRFQHDIFFEIGKSEN